MSDLYRLMACTAVELVTIPPDVVFYFDEDGLSPFRFTIAGYAISGAVIVLGLPDEDGCDTAATTTAAWLRANITWHP